VRARLAAGRPLVGPFLPLPHPTAAEVMAGLGFDYLCVEGEHSGLGTGTVQTLVASAVLAGSEVLVRVAAPEQQPIAAALDAGASGVIVPRVGSAAVAQAVVAAARYPPLGERGLGPGRATGYGVWTADYVARANEHVLVAVQIETRAGVERLDEILAVDGVDVIFVGPGDLGLSLGIAGGLDGLELREVIEGIVVRAHAAGRAAGMFGVTPETVAYWAKRGVELLLFGSDVGFLLAGATAARDRLAELLASGE